MREFSMKITGLGDLLVHDGKLANPMDPAAKELAVAYSEYKDKKTDESFYALARAEFMGGLYYVEGVGPVWPTDNLHSSLKKAGAKVVKSGRATFKNSVAAAILWDATESPLSYAGFGGHAAPRTVEDLWANENYRFIKAARVGSAKVQRTRPIFKKWKFEVTGKLDTDILDLAKLEEIAKIAGQLIGIGDWRPEKGGSYGRFTVEVTDLGEYDPLKAA